MKRLVLLIVIGAMIMGCGLVEQIPFLAPTPTPTPTPTSTPTPTPTSTPTPPPTPTPNPGAWFNASMELTMGLNMATLLNPIPTTIVSTLAGVAAVLQSMDTSNAQAEIDQAQEELAAWCDGVEGHELETCQEFTEMLDEIEQELLR